MRRHFRPEGFVDWPATIACVATAAAIVYFSIQVAHQWQIALWKCVIGMATLACGIAVAYADARAAFARGMLGWFAPMFRKRSALGTVTYSVAERDTVHRGPESHVDVELSARARHVIEVELEDGRHWTCVMPVKQWARFRIGMNVELVWQGVWLRSIRPNPDADSASASESGEVH